MQLVCEHCKEDFTTRSTTQARYCSRACHNEARRQWYTCKNCGISYNPGPNGGREYCSRACSGQRRLLQRIEKACEVCGTRFIVSTSSVKQCCSRACGWKLAQQLNTGQRRAEYVTLACEWCKIEFSLAKCYAHNVTLGSDKKYCSRKCKGMAKRGKWAIEDTRQVLVTCQECGKEHYCKPSEAPRKKYCSRECGGIARVRQLQGRTSTSIEIETCAALDQLEIEYIPQHRIGRWLTDVFIPSLNLVIECQGDFYHCNPAVFPNGPQGEIQGRGVDRDRRKRIDFTDKGYNLLELWESDIRQYGALALIQAYLNRQD